MKITLTGIDEKTDVKKLYAGIKPEWREWVEIALLFTVNQEGRNRYPSIEFIDTVLTSSLDYMAVHLCGKDTINRVLQGEFYTTLMNADRIQVNGKVSQEQLEDFCEMFHDSTIITQHVPYNYRLLGMDIKFAKEKLEPLPYQHSVLVDASGGKGILPTEWVAPFDTKKLFGVAGGLGPHNLREQLKVIPKDCYWVDMETFIRHPDSDLFSIEKTIKCIEIVMEHNEQQWKETK